MPLEPKVKSSEGEQGLNRWRKHLEQRMQKKKKSGVKGTTIPLTDMATSSTSVEVFSASGFTGYGYKPVGPDTEREEEEELIVRPPEENFEEK